MNHQPNDGNDDDENKLNNDGQKCEVICLQ